MESSFSRYIWKHTSREQIWIMCVVLLSMVPYYMAFDLPKLLINGPITGTGFDTTDATQPFMASSWFGGFELTRTETLCVLSFLFLMLVIINGLFKYYINTYKGLLGERLLRRVRFELVDRLLRFLPGEFKRVKGGEISSMVKDEVEPLGGFTAEAFVQPVLLGGQALTALGFIFVQHFWLGVVALFMASVQMVIIPRLRQRLLVLGRERQINARQLAGRVTEVVEGIETIHAYDTSNYERADLASRLGKLFRIRFEIYSRKYKIKFLNNFLAQVTPFMFYLIGGYLAITSRLDVGQLVAVITAYKELPGPLKQFIDWDMARQDVQVKYEQLVEQFDVDELIDPERQAIPTGEPLALGKPLSAVNITMEDEGGSVTLDNVSVTIDANEAVAVVGDAYSGANILAEAFAGISRPVKGKISAGKDNILDLPESVTGRRITYASSDTFFFSGSLRENLLYGLKNSPMDEVMYSGDEATRRQWERVEARRTGNPEFDLNSNWIDPRSVSGLSAEHAEVNIDAMRKVLQVAKLSDDVFDFALHSKIDVAEKPELAGKVVTLRKAVHAALVENDLEDLVIYFDLDRYNDQAVVLDNILFGILKSPDADNSEGIEYFRSILNQTGLDKDLFLMGFSIAESSRELFQDLPPDHPFFDRLEYMNASDLPQLRAMYQKFKGSDFDDLSADDRYAWINLSFMYNEPQYRFGLLTEELMLKIVETRKVLHENMPDKLKDGIDMYDPDSFLPSANLLDNIVFGKVDRRFKDVGLQLRTAIAPLFVERPDLYNSIYSVGLDYNVGPGGRRLTAAQRQKLNFARALMRKSDYYVFNRPVSGLDQGQQASIIGNTLDFLKEQEYSPSVVWVLASEVNSKFFDRCLTFDDKKIVEDKFIDASSVSTDTLTPG